LFFVILSSKCGIVLFVVLCDVWFRVLSWCSSISYWKIYISQLQIQQMIWASTLQIRKHRYFGDLGFIILFVGILPMYAINLGDVSLFADSSFTFLAMSVSDVLYQFEWMNIVLFLSKKKAQVVYGWTVKKNWVWVMCRIIFGHVLLTSRQYFRLSRFFLS